MIKLFSFRTCIMAFLALFIWLPQANAFEQYSLNRTSGNCADCHGGFRSSPYVSLADGVSWGDDLHDVHRRTMLNSDCNTCHGPSRFPVVLNSSNGGNGLEPVACAGCHARAETDAGGQLVAAGLRQHHFNNGVTLCADCHFDATPANFTTDGEDVLPPYYFTPDAAHPAKPTDPCSPNGEEHFAGSPTGMDNDGDNVYDQNDSDCQAPLSPGDLDKDGDVDIDDFRLIQATFGLCTGDAGFNADADYDQDGCVTFVDYQTWYGFFVNP